MSKRRACARSRPMAFSLRSDTSPLPVSSRVSSTSNRMATSRQRLSRPRRACPAYSRQAMSPTTSTAKRLPRPVSAAWRRSRPNAGLPSKTIYGRGGMRLPIAGSRLDWDKPRCFSQSAESRQVSALEHDLKVPLFHRHPHGLVLTGQGELLLLRAAREDELVHTEKLWKNAIATKRRDMGITLVPGHDRQHRRSQHSVFFRNIGGKGVNVGLFPRPDYPSSPIRFYMTTPRWPSVL